MSWNIARFDTESINWMRLQYVPVNDFFVYVQERVKLINLLVSTTYGQYQALSS